MLTITPEAKSWLDQKEKSAITLIKKVAKVNSCSCSRVNYMDVKLGAPKGNDEAFTKLEVDGVDIYYEQNVQLPPEREITVKLNSMLGLKSLKVEGLFDNGFMNA
jgi:hypothetical protein